MGKGTVYIVSAPSGGGKTSLVNKLVSEIDNIQISISYTTRPQRQGEINGVHYHFVSMEQFQSKVQRNEFLEYEEIFGNLYGTPQKEAEDLVNNGTDVIFDIDWHGARNVANYFASSCSIFIIPPSIEVLKQRLTARDAKANPNDIHNRLMEAKKDIQHYAEYDYLIVNDDFDKAYLDLKSIVVANRLAIKHQAAIKHKLIEELLK